MNEVQARAAFEAYYRECFPDADFTRPMWEVEWAIWWAAWQQAWAAATADKSSKVQE